VVRHDNDSSKSIARETAVADHVDHGHSSVAVQVCERLVDNDRLEWLGFAARETTHREGQGDRDPAPLPAGQIANRDWLRTPDPPNAQIEGLCCGRVRRLEPQFASRHSPQTFVRQVDDPPLCSTDEMELNALPSKKSCEAVVQRMAPLRSAEVRLKFFPSVPLSDQLFRVLAGCMAVVFRFACCSLVHTRRRPGVRLHWGDEDDVAQATTLVTAVAA